MSKFAMQSVLPTVLIQGADCDTGFHMCQSCKGNQNFRIRAGVLNMDSDRAKQLKEFSHIEVVPLNLEDKDQTEKALHGVAKVVLIPPYSDNQLNICYRLIDTAAKLDVKYFLLVSVSGSPVHGLHWCQNLRSIESKIHSTHIKFNVIRSAAYMDDFFTFKDDIKAGTLKIPNGKSSPVALTDLGDLTCCLLEEKSAYATQLDITGQEVYSHEEIAKILSRELGKSVAFAPINLEQFKQYLLNKGFPKTKAEGWTELFAFHEKEQTLRPTPENFEKVVGRKPITFAQFIQKYKEEFLA